MIAIDPGASHSGYVVIEFDPLKLIYIEEKTDNGRLLKELRWIDKKSPLAIEQIRGYGQVAGNDTYDTCEWAGRFREAYEAGGGIVYMMPRKDIKRHLCGNTTTNDKYIRQALVDRFGEVGTKKNSGPLYGMAGHLWAALAVAVTCYDQIKHSDGIFTEADAKIVEETGI